MAIFYAYAKSINDDVFWRYVIAFASRAVADEWWRAVSTSSITSYSDSVRRVNSQFYTHDPTQANVALSITNPNVAGKFLGKVFFTFLPDRDGRALSVIPPDHQKDHVSGNFYFIRSKTVPSEYWYCPESSTGEVQLNTPVLVSRTERSLFRVRIISERNEGTIMIGSDEIAITLASGDLSVRVAGTGQGGLIVTHTPEPGMKFSDLENGFRAGGTVLRQTIKGTAEVKGLFKVDDGEEWELV